MKYISFIFLGSILFCTTTKAQNSNHKSNDKSQNVDKDAKAEQAMINVKEEKNTSHTMHPGAQWFPEAGLGLFIHWGLSSVKNMDISWPMIPGRAMAEKKLDSLELTRVVREKDYNLNGKPPAITPNEYWAMAKDFNPQHYDPDKWIKAAKEAGFQYVVLTTRHHEGFALWPSAYGDFSTKNFIDGRDLLKPYVDAVRKYGLKLGFYYSPPNWYFDRDYMTFIYGRAYTNNPSLPKIGPDLNPRTTTKTEEEIKQHQAAYAAMVKGQVEEILTRYGKIDLLWFDGKPPIPNGSEAITQEEIRKLQPGIVINPRLHGKGDYITFERNPPKQDPGDTWAEFCNTWTNSWANSNTQPFRSNAFVLGEFVAARAWGVNYLLGVGPTSDGVFPQAVYDNMNVVGHWMKKNRTCVQHVTQLPSGETASVPATAKDNFRYLFAIPKFKNGSKYEQDRLPATDETLLLKTLFQPKSVSILESGQKLNFKYTDGQVIIDLPSGVRTNLVDVIQVELKK
jgi:alpha-L-fucosidase